MMVVIPSHSYLEGKSCHKISQSINQDRTLLVITTLHVMRLSLAELSMPLDVLSESTVSTNSPRTSISKSIASTSRLDRLNILSQERLYLFKFHHTMDLVMKLTHLATSSNFCQTSQNVTSSSMLIMTRRF